MKFFEAAAKFMPRFLRIKIMRLNIRIGRPESGFQIKIANTKEELEKAYSLLHDCYVGINLMYPDKSGLRCNFYSFLYWSRIICRSSNGFATSLHYSVLRKSIVAALIMMMEKIVRNIRS